jgi:AraC family transcriptional regulator of adaptative response/methylated-DNA-[protein]-cysteine methyltransferase
MYSFDQKYQAVLTKNPAFEGVFITAVKTTGIFCRPVCTARKPKPENVVFFDTCKEAIVHGYRPCKVCKPLEKIAETPQYIQNVLEAIQQNPLKKIKDWDLRQQGIEPSHIRRWFKQHHNLTFHAYQRMMRINMAFTKISNGETVTDAAFDVGFESLSGFNDCFKNIVGSSAGNSKHTTIIHIIRFTTPLGPMFACATEQGLCLLEFTDRKMLETELKDIQRLLKATLLPGSNRHLVQVQQELGEYFEGKRKAFSVALHTPGTAFQQAVWTSLHTIPYGATASYKQQAVSLNKPQAIRAMASANGCNRISILIPCHRVIGEDGDLKGYGGGIVRKKWLLDFEKKHS